MTLHEDASSREAAPRELANRSLEEADRTITPKALLRAAGVCAVAADATSIGHRRGGPS
jgi:hypothetical protein